MFSFLSLGRGGTKFTNRSAILCLCGSVFAVHNFSNANTVTNRQDRRCFGSFPYRAICDAYLPTSSSSASSSSSQPSAYLDDILDADLDDHFHLASSIEDMKSRVEVNKMLDIFRVMYQSGEDITLNFLTEVFYQAGITDQRIADRLFEIMDRNGDGKLQPSEIFAVLTLFAGGDQTQRFKFLFNCLDLDGGGTVDKDEFRASLTAILEARYNLGGLKDPYEPDEIFSNVLPHEYHTIAKFKANRIVRDIFIVADTNRDGELQLKEFLYWCRRGDKEVRLLHSALISAVEVL